MNTELVEALYHITENYVKSTDRQQYVDHLVKELIEFGFDERDLVELRGINSYFAKACEMHIHEEEEEDEIDWNGDYD